MIDYKEYQVKAKKQKLIFIYFYKNIFQKQTICYLPRHADYYNSGRNSNLITKAILMLLFIYFKKTKRLFKLSFLILNNKLGEREIQFTGNY